MALSGGFQVGPDGRIHTTFGHNPSSGRLCSFDPNMQQIPRGGGSGRLVKECFIAPPGKVFWERDFSGIEAVLVGYFAGAREYVRLAKMDVHSFYTAYGLHALDGRVSANDLPQLSWDDEKLRTRLAEIKREFKDERNSLYKHLVHGANFLQTPNGARRKIFKETGTLYDLSIIRKVMHVYFELFPLISQWHRDLTRAVDGTRHEGSPDAPGGSPSQYGIAFARNPFNYVHHFYNVLEWSKIDGEWYSTYGADARRLVSFLPQSTAAAIIKQSARTLWYELPWVGQTIRLLIHDSIFGECDEADLETCLQVSGEVMEAPIMQLPLDPTWQMGTHLSINTEAKTGTCWGEM